MNVTILQTTLNQALKDLKRVVPLKPQLPILSSLLLEATETGIWLSATDLYTGIRTKVGGTVTETGTLAIPARVFAELVATLPAGDISLITDGGTLEVKTARSTTKLQFLPGDDYPPFPEKEGHELTLAAAQLGQVIQQVALAAAKDDSRPVLNSLLFVFGENLEVVATDGFRLACLKLDHQMEPARLLIPVAAVQEIHRVSTAAKAQHVTLTVSHKLKQLFGEFADTQLVVRLMEGEFPPYEKVIPPSCALEINLDRQECIQQLKAALVFAREGSHIIKFSTDENELTITASSSTLGEHHSTMPITSIKPGSASIAFNAQYVMEFLQSVDGDQIYFGMNESLQPAIFRPAAQPEYAYVVMPFRTAE